MKEGIIVNDEDMTMLWDYCIKRKLNIEEGYFRDRKILLTEAPWNPNENKKKMGEIIFEKMGFGAFNIEPQAKLSLFYEGLQTGIILDSGDNVTYCIPIFENFLLHNRIKRLDIAGRHITEKLIKLLKMKGYSFNSIADFEIAREIKENYCFVSCDIELDRKLEKETTYYNSIYKLPDGRKIRISDEKFEATEILFQPCLNQLESPGIHEMLFEAINGCDSDLRKELYKNIVLSGANTMFAGYASRLMKEMVNIYKDNELKIEKVKRIKIPINIIDSPIRKYSTFIGATILANVYNNPDSETDYWITKQDWEEWGPDIIYKKCQNIIP